MALRAAKVNKNSIFVLKLAAEQFTKIDCLHLTLHPGDLDGVLYIHQTERAGGDDDIGTGRSFGRGTSFGRGFRR